MSARASIALNKIFNHCCPATDDARPDGHGVVQLSYSNVGCGVYLVRSRTFSNSGGYGPTRARFVRHGGDSQILCLISQLLVSTMYQATVRNIRADRKRVACGVSSSAVDMDITDSTTPSVDADRRCDTRKPVDHESAAPERGEQFAPHRRAMPDLRHRVRDVATGRPVGVLLRDAMACMRASIKVFICSGSSRVSSGSAFLSCRASRWYLLAPTGTSVYSRAVHVAPGLE